MGDRHSSAVRAVTLHNMVVQQPWQELQKAVLEALDRLETAGWPGGVLVGNNQVIWKLPHVPQPVSGKPAVLAFDTEGRLLGWASRLKEWCEVPNGWEFYARVAGEYETSFALNYVNSIAR